MSDTHHITVEVNNPGPITVSTVGLQGTPGSAGAGAGTLVFDQPTPSTVWTVDHALGYQPSVAVVVDGAEVVAAVERVSITRIVVTHSAPQSGSVYLS